MNIKVFYKHFQPFFMKNISEYFKTNDKSKCMHIEGEVKYSINLKFKDRSETEKCQKIIYEPVIIRNHKLL